MQRTPIALTIAGSDSGGGAGIQADLKTFSALGVFGTSAITAVTAQNTRTVTAVHALDDAMVRAQILAVVEDFSINAYKVGMLANAAIICTVADCIRNSNLHPLVLDPVMIAKSGDALLSPEATTALRERLLPLADIITPNIPEAACLLSTTNSDIMARPEDAAQRLSALTQTVVLLKGGHSKDTEVTDYLVLPNASTIKITRLRIDTQNTHGTGCTLSAAICAFLARGDGLATAVTRAREYIHFAIMHAGQLQVGQGHGPVHHFYRCW